MPVIETSIHKASGFSTYFFHTLDLLHKSLIDTETADVRQINTDRRR